MPLTIAQALRARGIDPIDARALLEHALGVDAAYLAARPELALSAARQARFERLLERRRAGEPVAYLVGRREFFSLEFAVTPAVLIPRPETELLVEQAVERLPADAASTVLDLGTGSGCIAIALARERPRARVTAVDRSAAALTVARRNAGRLSASNVEFVRSDWFAALAPGAFDLIVANPPYIADADPCLASGDARFEPRAALAGGADGLDRIRDIVARAPAWLDPGGWLLFEHGYDQAQACRNLLDAANFREIASYRDLAGIERVSAGRR